MDYEQFKSPIAPKRRSNRACQACRVAKTKCHLIDHELQCRRCIATSSSCLFPVSRRGRIKGSKNRRTIQKLLAGGSNPRNTDEQQQPCAVGDSQRDKNKISQYVSQNENEDEDEYEYSEIQSPGSYTSAIHPTPPVRSANIVTERSQDADNQPSDLNSRLEAPMISRATTPWNPQNMVMNAEQGHDSHRPPLSRNLQRILGEFPVERGKSNDKSSEPKGLQDPLWLIIGLSERGWNLNSVNDAHNAERSARDRNAPIPTVSALPVTDARLLSKWSPQALQGIEKEQEQFIAHGIYGSKCDVAHALDPINHGLLTEQRACELFRVYWQCLHPQWGILDPTLHTVARVRTRSALLTTTILALASTVLSILPHRADEQVAEALRLHAHVEKLSLVVFTTAAKSVDIVQAQILLSRWGTCPKTRLDEQRWMRVAMIPRMAAEIGLHLPRRYSNSTEISSKEMEMLRRNDIRTRAYMILSEHRFFTFSGRPAMDTSQFELTDAELEDITIHRGDQSATSLVPLYHLFVFDRDVRLRLEQSHPNFQTNLSLSTELEHIKTYIEKWIKDWCPKEGNAQLNWHLTHDALSSWLLLAIRVARKRLQLYKTTHSQPQCRNQQNQEQQQLLRYLSVRLFEEALCQAPSTICMTHRASIFPFAAPIVLKLSEKRDLVLRVGLRMAGEPGRPFVPTFVREAGTQLLLMSRNTTSNLSAEPEFVNSEGGTAQEPLGSSNQHSEHEGDIGTDTASQQRDRYTERDHEETFPQEQLAPEIPFLPDHGPSIFEPQANNDSLFAFDFSDLPCVSNPIPPPYHSMIYTHCPSVELDDLIRTASPQNFGNLNDMRQDSSMNSAHDLCTNPSDFEIPMDSTIGNNCHVPIGQENASSTWRPEMLTPNSTSFILEPPDATGQIRNPQKEILMATVGWLNQIASLMQ